MLRILAEPGSRTRAGLCPAKKRLISLADLANHESSLPPHHRRHRNPRRLCRLPRTSPSPDAQGRESPSRSSAPSASTSGPETSPNPPPAASSPSPSISKASSRTPASTPPAPFPRPGQRQRLRPPIRRHRQGNPRPRLRDNICKPSSPPADLAFDDGWFGYGSVKPLSAPKKTAATPSPQRPLPVHHHHSRPQPPSLRLQAGQRHMHPPKRSKPTRYQDR